MHLPCDMICLLQKFKMQNKILDFIRNCLDINIIKMGIQPWGRDVHE